MKLDCLVKIEKDKFYVSLVSKISISIMSDDSIMWKAPRAQSENPPEIFMTIYEDSIHMKR